MIQLRALAQQTDATGQGIQDKRGPIQQSQAEQWVQRSRFCGLMGFLVDQYDPARSAWVKAQALMPVCYDPAASTGTANDCNRADTRDVQSPIQPTHAVKFCTTLRCGLPELEQYLVSQIATIAWGQQQSRTAEQNSRAEQISRAGVRMSKGQGTQLANIYLPWAPLLYLKLMYSD